MKDTIVLAWNRYHICIRSETEKHTFAGVHVSRPASPPDSREEGR